MFDEDLSVFFDSDGIGNAATVAGSAVDGIFERQFAEVDGIEGYYPTFLTTDEVAAGVTKRVTAIAISGVNYTAISKRPDGTGATLLVLERS